ncbi:MAG: type II toxin-antitoxin system RelE/ParE family toxin [Emcibacter sp.]|nr:type II toxin-antitoxin system RelE/ParE family toxin [Emcibacter sp.]
MTDYNVHIPQIIKEKIKQQAHIIALDKPNVALDWYDMVFNKIFSLYTMPKRCPEAPENLFTLYTTRHLLIGDYRILFRIIEARVLILDFKGGREKKPS